MSVSERFTKTYEIRQSLTELVSALRRVVEENKIQLDKVAVDFGSITAETMFLMEEKIGKLRKNDLRDFIFSERSVKSEYEIKEMEKAIAISRRAFEKTIQILKDGMSVGELTKILNKSMIDEGAEGPSFVTDIKMRRGTSEDDVDKLERGDIILFDFGAKLSSNYLSDLGRTVPHGSPVPEIRDLLKSDLEIKREGLLKITSGKSGNDVRKEIDEIISQHGFDSTHREGHQIGLNVHEPYGPHLAFGKENSSNLKEGSVVTWEPGLGLRTGKRPRNRFGMAHMEDMVLVKPESSKILGEFPLDYT